MGAPHRPLPVRLFTGLIAGDPALFIACEQVLVSAYGPMDLASDVVPWEHTAYYLSEMGDGLKRKFLFFSRLIDPGELFRIKEHTIGIEESFSMEGPEGRKRRVNIDPGYLTESKVVLATTKDFPHRVYLGGGIYGEVALHYRKNGGTYEPLEHTYPDYRMEQTIRLFNHARTGLRHELGRRSSP